MAIAKLGRLGKHERRILLTAPPPTAEAVVVEAAGPGPASAEVHRRALHRLAETGLLSLGWSRWGSAVDATTQGWPRIYRRRTARRTPLGQAVVEQVGAELEHGRRIRWARYRPSLLAAVRRPIHELLAAFREGLSARREAQVGLAACLASFRGAAAASPAARERVAELDAVLRAVDVALAEASAVAGDPGAELSGRPMTRALQGGISKFCRSTSTFLSG